MDRKAKLVKFSLNFQFGRVYIYRNNWEHHLRDIECMPPIVISNISIVLFDAQQPSAQNFIINMKTFNKVQLQEHSQTCLSFCNGQPQQKKREKTKSVAWNKLKLNGSVHIAWKALEMSAAITAIIIMKNVHLTASDVRVHWEMVNKNAITLNVSSSSI